MCAAARVSSFEFRVSVQINCHAVTGSSHAVILHEPLGASFDPLYYLVPQGTGNRGATAEAGRGGATRGGGERTLGTQGESPNWSLVTKKYRYIT